MRVTATIFSDLKAVFAKHNWSGHPIGIVAHPAVAALGAQPCDLVFAVPLLFSLIISL
jgi:hypothetical protein